MAAPFAAGAPMNGGGETGRLARVLRTPEGLVLQWRLQRHCSLRPGQFFAACLGVMVFNAVVGAVFYDEAVETTLFLGAALIFLGIWITLRGATTPQVPDVTKP